MTRTIGPKEAQRRALREAPGLKTIAELRVPPRTEGGAQWGPNRVIQRFPPVKGKKPAKTLTAPRKQGLGEAKRMGRPPSLKKADYEAVGAATPDELAVALRWYRAQLAGARKRRLDTTA
jgi:hypothetical protein